MLTSIRRFYSIKVDGTKWKQFVPTEGNLPKGFKAGSVYSGVKRRPENLTRDLSVVVSLKPCVAVSGVFTKNSFAAAPVQLCRELLSRRRPIQALVINSACANACTGARGLEDAQVMSRTVSEVFKTQGDALVMSTGVIGQHLDMQKITGGLRELSSGALGDDYQSLLNLALGIMTTDTFPKLLSREFELPSSKAKFRLAGVCKGAGMIHPNMATMLACVLTDINISQGALDTAVSKGASSSFNAISVDGDTSTNDSFIVMASGAASGREQLTREHKDFVPFCEILSRFSQELATLIVRDGEGATKFVTVHVRGANSFNDAFQAARSIAKSSLVKTALFGQDANWGRIICALGYSGVSIVPDKVSLTLSSPQCTEELVLFKDGAPNDTNEDEASAILKNTDIELTINLGLGNSDAKMFTCDLSEDYVKINADYRS